MSLMVLLLPSVLAVGLCHFLLPPAGWWPTAAAVLAWSGLVYVVGSSLAVRRIEHAEDKLLVWLASRSAG